MASSNDSSVALSQLGAATRGDAAPHNLTIQSLLIDLHALTLERVSAAQLHAASAAQIAALSANLHDALAIQQQMQTKIQMLEYGLKIERKHNAALMSSHRANAAVESRNGGLHPAAAPNANGVGPVESTTDVSGAPASRRTLTYHTLPSAFPSPAEAGVDIDPALFAAYMAAVDGSHASSPTNADRATLPRSLPPPGAGKTHNDNMQTPPPAVSPSPDDAPSTAVKVSQSPPSLSFNYETQSPVKSSNHASGATSTVQHAFKPPSLSANMFLPPTADEIAAEIALAKSPPVVHPAFKGSRDMPPRSRSDAADRGAPDEDLVLDRPGLDRPSTVYNYGSPQPSSESPFVPSVPNADSHALAQTAININTSSSKEDSSNGGHVRLASSSSLLLGAGSPMNASSKQWRPKLQLRSHLDAVRSVSFDRAANKKGNEPTWLLSGSEDGTAQIWNLTSALAGSGSARKGAPQPLPLHSYRGHQGAVTAVTLNSDVGAFTAGVDGQVVQWSLPAVDSDLYASYGTVSAFRLAAHSHENAVWSMDLLPGNNGTNVLLAAVADGSVAVWHTASASGGAASLMRTLRTPGGAVPTSVQFVPSSAGRLAAASFVDGTVSVLDVETGVTVATLREVGESGSPADPSRATQLVAHPTQDLLMSGHVDTVIRVWDIKSSSRVSVIPAHRGVVSCLAFDGDGTNLVSGSHDESIRIWSTADRKIKQVLDTHQTHRLKYDEAIHSVTYHPSLPYLASAGGDGIVKVYV